jgi:starch-binding outer membrane protein, SusD/RagB family
MKKITYFLIVGFVFIFNSCGKLEEEPTTFFSEDRVFSSEDGVESAVNGLYYSLGAFNFYGSAFVNLTLPHSGLFFSSQAANVDVVGMNATPSNINLIDLWAAMYSTTNTANVIIDNLEKSDLKLANKDASLGNAYFIRGKVYLDLYRLFGGVPLRLSPASIDNLHQARNSKQEVIAQVIADLTKAKTLMPDKSILGRPAKWAANVSLAKLYMTLANDDAQFWPKAQAELLAIIQSGKYKLQPSYASLFQLGTENTQESIFEIQYSHTGGLRTSDLIRLFTPSASTYSPANVTTFGRIRPNKEVFDNHVATYADDPRIKATYVFNEYPRHNTTPQKIYPITKTGNNGFTVIAKYLDATYNGATSERNYILMRYADVLLMMAEVTNEISGPDAAYTFVNQVLTRARDANGDGTPDAMSPANWTGMTKEVFRNRIMLERRYELLSEGEDWFDTRRRGYDYFTTNVVRLHNNNKTIDKTRDVTYPENTRNMLFPIPLTEISGNQQVNPADQNPGY